MISCRMVSLSRPDFIAYRFHRAWVYNYSSRARLAYIFDNATSATKKQPTVHATFQSPYKSLATRIMMKSIAAVNCSASFCTGSFHPSSIISPRNFNSPSAGQCHSFILRKTSLSILATRPLALLQMLPLENLLFANEKIVVQQIVRPDNAWG
jgi:hypothetical protein